MGWTPHRLRNGQEHGGSEQRIWRKIHVEIDEKTLKVRAVDVTDSNIGDARILPELLDKIWLEKKIGSVTGDGFCDTRRYHDSIAGCGAHTVIPPRKNAKTWKTVTTGAVAPNEALRASTYVGRASSRRWSG